MKYIIILLILLTTQITYAATIHGTIYDLSLKPVKNTLVEIDTKPPQKLVSKDGDYQFSLPKGIYTIKAKAISSKLNLTTEEHIELINEEGNFILDLFLLPEETEIKEEKTTFLWYLPLILLIIAIIALIYLKKPKKAIEKKEEATEGTEKLIKIIKDSGGRITQKELRKHFPLSEAKISLMLTELEAKGKIEKIKKGRGNIIILKQSQ